MILLLCFLSLTISCKKTTEKLPEYMFVSSNSGSVLRSAPDVNSNSITTLPYMTKVHVIKQSDEQIFLSERFGKWINVKTDKNEGWLFSGFLCEFQPDSIIKVAAEFYRTQYRNNKYFSKYDEYINFKDNQVKIINIIDKYITLEIPVTSRTDITIEKGNVIWKFDPTNNKFFEVFNIGHSNNTTLLYLNEDNFPDLIVEDGCCSSPDVHIYLGSEKEFSNVYELKEDCNSDEYYNLKLGNCDNMTFECSNISSKTVTVRVNATDVPIDEKSEVLRHYKFNCSNKKIEMYGEGLIKRASGLITVLDIKNKTISIKDEDDNTNRTFLLSDDVFVSGKTAKSLSDLKIGEDVSLAYEDLNGQNITLRIDSQEGWDHSSFGQSGLVVAVDFKTKKLALKYSGYYYIYDLADDVVFENTGKRTADQLEINEDVKIYFDKGKVNRITTSGIYLNGSVVSIDQGKRIIAVKAEDGSTMNLEIATFATISIQHKTGTISEIQEGKNFTAHYVNLSNGVKYITSIQVSK